MKIICDCGAELDFKGFTSKEILEGETKVIGMYAGTCNGCKQKFQILTDRNKKGGE